MNKTIKRLASMFMALAIILLALTPMVHATQQNTPDETTVLYLETTIDKSLTIPLTLEANKDVFYLCANINPGDTMKSHVTFENTSDSEIQVSIADIINQLTDNPKAKALLDILELSISVNGSPIYKGIHSKVTTPVTGWITLKPGEMLVMDIEIYFPKEADNTYQNSQMEVKWVFEARADVPPDPEKPSETTTTETTTETHQTGDEKMANYGIYLLLGAAAVAAVGIGVVATKKKKEDE